MSTIFVLVLERVNFSVTTQMFADFALWTLGSRQHVNTRAKGNRVKAVREG